MVTDLFIFRQILIFCIFLFSAFCFSQNKNDSLRFKNISEVHLYKKDFKEILPAQTLSGVTLDRMNSHSVADVMRYFSGVQIKDYGGIGGLKTINIRSMGSQHIGVFYDGIQLGNAQNGVVDLGKFSLDDIEEISLYNGQKSDIFQPAKDFGASGSVYLQPKIPSFEKSRKTNLTVRLKNSSIDLFNPSFRIERKISERISASFSSEFLQSDGFYKYRYRRLNLDNSVAYDTIAKRLDGDITAKRFESGWYGKMDGGDWAVRGYAYLSDRGIPAAIVNGRFGARGQRLIDENFFVQGHWRKKLFPKFETQLKLKAAYDFTHFIDTVRTQAAYPVENEYIQRELYFSTSNLYTISPVWDVNLSYDFQYNNLDANLINFSYPERFTSLLAMASTYQWRRLKFMGSFLGTFVRENVERNTKSPDKAEWTPALFLSYQPFESKDFHLRAFYKRIFRMPTFNDLYYTMIGNSFLKPEYTSQYNLGFAYKKKISHPIFKSINVKMDGYFNKVEDKIIAAPNGSMFRWMMLNLGNVEILGIDMNVQSELHLGSLYLKPLLNYTYQRARDFTDRAESYYGHQIPYTPWHSGSFSLLADYKTWGFNYSFVYVGERYDAQQNNIRYNYVQPWYTHDLSLHKNIFWGEHKFRASFEINNILNQYYDVVLNYPMPGRNFRFILSFVL